MFKYSDSNKRYHSLDYYFKQKYGTKVGKICLDAGYSCKNRDGTKSNEGCYFCELTGNSDLLAPEDLLQQIAKQKTIIQRKWPQAKYQLYFQNYANTYADLATNQKNYELYKSQEDIVALAIATRVDSIEDATLAYLDTLCGAIDVTIELGLQSCHDSTRQLLNCQYSLAEFTACVDRIAQTKCAIVVHIINGLPQESQEMMLATAEFINRLPINGLKIHMLYLSKGSMLEKQYRQEPFKLLSLDQYSDIVVKQLRRLRPELVIHRLTGDGHKGQLLAPLWTLNKTAVLNMIDKKMAAGDFYQGDYA